MKKFDNFAKSTFTWNIQHDLSKTIAHLERSETN